MILKPLTHMTLGEFVSQVAGIAIAVGALHWLGVDVVAVCALGSMVGHDIYEYATKAREW